MGSGITRPIGLLIALAALVAIALAPVAARAAEATAPAGQASSGELLFYPCTTCHPVVMGADGQPTRPLPNGITGHDIVLSGHDKLGRGSDACLACHDDPARNPGKLKAIDGSLIDIKGDVALVCYRCHESKYKEFVAGVHGKRKPSCVAAGCHDPHTPGWIYASPLFPFAGSGFQFRVLPGKATFTALAPPPPAPPTLTPAWYTPLALVGYAAALGLAGTLALGRLKR